MKKLALIPFLFTLGLVFLLVWFFMNVGPVAGKVSYVNFTVPAGATASQIGNSLFKNGLIKNPTVFKVYVQFSGIAGRIQAGDYRLSPGFNLFQVASVLSKAPLEVKVTIPEGFRREEVAVKFAKSLDQGSSFTAEFLDETGQDEGYLFPDTYLVSGNATPGAIINKMKSNFNTKVDSLKPENSGLSESELIILASIIERETKTDEERPVVAGILLNRLDKGWPLQVDSTVQYAVATARCKSFLTSCTWWQPPGSADLEIKSPFNTYKNAGLPPSPIANPGLSSIKAAYNPEKTDYFFYLHDSQGQIHYAHTLEEQDANIKKYLQ